MHAATLVRSGLADIRGWRHQAFVSVCLFGIHTPWKLETHRFETGGGLSYLLPTQTPNKLTPSHRLTVSGQAGWPGPLHGARDIVRVGAAMASVETRSTRVAEIFIFGGLIMLCKLLGTVKLSKDKVKFPSCSAAAWVEIARKFLRNVEDNTEGF